MGWTPHAHIYHISVAFFKKDGNSCTIIQLTESVKEKPSALSTRSQQKRRDLESHTSEYTFLKQFPFDLLKSTKNTALAKHIDHENQVPTSEVTSDPQTSTRPSGGPALSPLQFRTDPSDTDSKSVSDYLSSSLVSDSSEN